ncbi:hypothetical protein [Acinetobacter sp. ULE_I037]|uniref:hypothetical protein n=1 Tax=unclassified Acinetobacter TaxID=196816 RepID=UPI003AF919A7
MNAVEFVKKFGWERSKKAVWLSITEFSRAFDIDSGFIICRRKDLKRLVESYELVEKHGGLENAKEDELWANELGFGFKGLAQAIRDVKSVGGGV